MPVTINGSNTPTAGGITYGDGTQYATTAAGTSGQVLKSNGSSAPTWGSASTTIVRSARTSNTILGAADVGTLIAITSGTFTQTFTAAATLGSGWFCYIQNLGTGDITLDPNASETIDGLTSYIMYPGEARLVQCDGTAFYTIVLNAFIRSFTTTSTFTAPPGYDNFCVDLVGGGGGGGGPASTTPCGGGGAGARAQRVIPGSLVTGSITVTIGAGGAGGTAADGTSGGTTTFGSLLSAYGGGSGRGNANSAGGGGGGCGGAGATGTASGNGGNPRPSVLGLGNNTAVGNIGGGGGGGGGTSNLSGGSAEWGGGGGGSGTAGGGGAGGSSVWGPGGGGGGGQPGTGGGRGGSTGTYTAGGGGSAVATGAGGNGADGTLFTCGAGGGGGSSTNGATGYAGGNGGFPGGGGGGAGADTGTTTGTGGTGGNGRCVIWGME